MQTPRPLYKVPGISALLSYSLSLSLSLFLLQPVGRYLELHSFTMFGKTELVPLLLFSCNTALVFAAPQPQHGNWVGQVEIAHSIPEPLTTMTTTTISSRSIAVSTPSASVADQFPTIPGLIRRGVSSANKRGLAYNSSSPTLEIFSNYPQITWAMDWDSATGGVAFPSGVQFVPLLWDDTAAHTSSWDSNARAAISGAGSATAYLMAFNEPDIPSQANMPVAKAVSSYQTLMNGYSATNVKLGSPAVSNAVSSDPNNPQGIAYLASFLSSCGTACIVDFVTTHWYGCTNGCALSDDVASFQSHVSGIVGAAEGRDVWVTEFQSFGDQSGFLTQVLPWLDGQGQVKRYSYFMVVEGTLTSGNGLSTLGTTYVS